MIYTTHPERAWMRVEGFEYLVLRMRMKLSLAWIFDHIVGSWHKISVEDLIEKFNKTVAEISSYHVMQFDLKHLFLVQVVSIGDKIIGVACPETKKNYELPFRAGIANNEWYLIIQENNMIRWATMRDIGSSKDSILPAFFCAENEQQGGWKKVIEPKDYVFEIDNKSITHRPDLWGHRGMAREIAALLNVSMVPEEKLCTQIEIQTHQSSGIAHINALKIENKIPALCNRFAGAYLENITYRSSLLPMAFRLSSIDAKPINALVDTTNYVMFDLGQPLHAYDAQKISTYTISVQAGKRGQKLTLLDDTVIEIYPEDMVISDGKQPLGLAGIMGGVSTAVSPATQTVFIEAAHFDPGHIRKSSLHHKKRTESSTRFEKNLDPMLNIFGLQRFLHIAHHENILQQLPDALISLGAIVEPKKIELSHAYIQEKIGAVISDEFIITTLTKLGFAVKKDEKQKHISYYITIPTFRATAASPEDIVEEIVRFYGFDRIEKMLPPFAKKASSIIPSLHKRIVKNVVAFGWQAYEVNNYALYDEQFLHTLSWKPRFALKVINPVSSNWQQLATSLIPHLLKNVTENNIEYDRLRFFEWQRTWLHTSSVIEKQILAGISYTKKELIDFYHEKNDLMILFDALGIQHITWKKMNHQDDMPWYDPYRSAQLMYQDKVIGYAGAMNQLFLQKVTQGDAFIFELDIEALLSISYDVEKKFVPLPKFPHTAFDISTLVPIEVSFDQIKQYLDKADDRIFMVEVVDYFQKDEWLDKKSITVRCYARDTQKTLTKEEIDEIYQRALSQLAHLGIEIR